MVQVESQHLRSVTYNKGSSTLTITFKRGGTYKYYDVPQKIYEDLLEAESKSTYFRSNIKMVFSYDKVGR